MWVSEELQKSFGERYERALSIIRSSGIPYIKVGLFGSYARDEFKADSDIDFCIVCENLPPRRDAAYLRCLLDEIDVDCVIMTRTRFETEASRFMDNLRRDLVEVLL